MLRLFHFGQVHGPIGPGQQVVRQLARHQAALLHRPELQAHDAHVHRHAAGRESIVLVRPVVAFNRRAEPLGNDPAVAGIGEIGDEEAELVAAESRVQLVALVRRPVLRHDVLRANLLAQQARDAFDDPVSQRVPVGVVEILERADVHQADGAPVAALLGFEELLETFDEAPEVHQPRLGIAVRAIGEIGDQLLEVLRDAADGGFARRELLAHPPHAVRKAGGHRLQRFLLRRLPHELVPRDHVIHRLQQGILLGWREGQLLSNPVAEVADRFWLGQRGKGIGLVRSRIGHPGSPDGR